jgi:NAD(P)-dependent dehydrogenase (short-subunit alcohol dehydrogenase family)
MSPHKNDPLTGKICLITGGAQGIGWATALALADENAIVHILAHNLETIQTAQAEAHALGFSERIFFTQGDVAQKEQVDEWVRDVQAQHGRIDVLINNAAYYRWDLFETLPLEEFQKTIEVCLYGTLYATKAILPIMRQQSGGHIINIASSAGKLFVSRNLTAYCTVKAAINAFTQTLAFELKGSPIAVTVVRPATVGGTHFFRKNVKSTQLPRLGDYVPILLPPDVARGVLHVIKTRQECLDIPGYLLRPMYLFFEIMPELLRLLANWGGNARKDIGNLNWQYKPKRTQ